MKLIDKYLIRNFLTPFIYCVLAFTMIFIIFDLFNTLSDFLEAKTQGMQIFQYYLYIIPSVVVYIIPTSLMLALLYTLSHMTKNNELTAMRASGVSLYRLMLPFIVVGFIASIAVAIINETIGPWSAYWTDQFIEAEKHKHEYNSYIKHNLALKNTRQYREWFIGTFNSMNYEMNNVRIIQQRPDGSDAAKIWAKKAEWLDGEWWLSDVIRQDYRANGRPDGGPRNLLGIGERTKSVSMPEFSETPEDFLNERKDARENPEQFSSHELMQYINRHVDFSKQVRSRVMTDFYSRMAMPWTCLVVVLLGIPFGSQTARKGAILGITMALGLFFSYYILINVGVALGKGLILPPWFAAWLPNLVFFCLGITLVYRMR